MLHLPALKSQKIIVIIAPQQGVRACGVEFAFFVKCLLLFGGEVEVFESDLPVIGDSGVEIVKVVENAVIHTADTVGNIAPPI